MIAAVRAQLDEVPKPTPENINNRSYMLKRLFRFYFQQDRPYQEVCGYCHGNVKAMTVAQRQKSLTMGWCANCHQKDHPVGADLSKTGHGPNDCFTCHK